MREIKGEAITQAVARLCMSANRNLPQDVRACITQSQAREPWEPARGILAKIVENYKIAEEDQLPICQDTGVACVFLEVGQEVHIQGGFGAGNSCRRPPGLSGGRSPVLCGGGSPAPGEYQGQHPCLYLYPSGTW